ncbi:hypothetical protein Q8791_19585 [Nocardiopsis sp. CT-R113]|uniref:Htaa domain-containing protein n=1 Tax=Nocardiopsis codii TaxID=3065942 RepID=A0ABU7KB06_9ACTN|nr:hypothetical protein [Nocardiopsis sp. CT-R113]
MVTPAKPNARRLVGAGVLFAALGAIGPASALPASASTTPMVWGNAQAWVADGDVVTGYSTAVSFGGETEASDTADDLFGPMAAYMEIDGESHTLVDDEGARAAATVDTATFRMGVADLAAHGMVDVPPGVELDEPSEEPREEPSPEDSTPLQDDPSSDATGEERVPGGAEEEGGQPPESEKSPEAPGDRPGEAPEPSPSEEDEVVVLDETNSDTVAADDNAVEFTLADVATTAGSGYAGSTEASFEHGDLTAFGVPVGPVGTDGVVVEDVLELFDEKGDVALSVPVSVRFVANETTFEDEDADWDGKGIRSWMTAWVQVGDPEEEQGFAVDFADSWALGSTYAASAPPVPGDKGEAAGEDTAARPDNRLATTGSSLAGLITAAVVAVGGGAAATFLARKRTTAMDDQIGD